jgi:hypothetical protein
MTAQISTAQDIATYLAAQSVGTFGTNIFVSREPPEPNECVTVYDTGGLEPDTDDLNLLRPKFQVRVRSATYEGGYTKQSLIRDLLILVAPIKTANSVFVAIMVDTDFISLGRDDKDRYTSTMNYRAIRNRS